MSVGVARPREERRPKALPDREKVSWCQVQKVFFVYVFFFCVCVCFLGGEVQMLLFVFLFLMLLWAEG